MGSPPHARGKAATSWRSGLPDRITPARAGKSKSERIFSKFIQDHPRTRGEKHRRARDFWYVRGSPPHARGKVRCVDTVAGIERITPARAGKSHFFGRLFCGCGDHPRTRGEKQIPQGRSAYYLGSPPHARGKAKRTQARRRAVRITPARAGKRKIADFFGLIGRDHPRTRGEKLR